MFFCLSLIVILSLSLVSAGWFSDLFGKETGNVIISESCSGEAISCSDFISVSSCNNQDGCSWGVMTANAIAVEFEEGLASGCSGTATPCLTFYSEDSCKNQKGCSWSENDNEVKPSIGCVFGETKCVEQDSYVCNKIGEWQNKVRLMGSVGILLKRL